jgi:hypothetical protein
MTSFELRVTFSGLNLFLIQEDCTKVAVVQPDCRNESIHKPPHPGGGAQPINHVGYLRFDLANLVTGIPQGTERTGPRYEVVHRFAHEDLSFGLPDTGSMSIRTGLPRFERIAPVKTNSSTIPADECNGDKSLLEPVSGLFGVNKQVLMRTVLTGGTLEGAGITEWEFPKSFDSEMPDYTGNFPEEVTWTRIVNGDHLDLSLMPFVGGSGTIIRLKPAAVGGRQVVELKVANLCADNPLEWPEFDPVGNQPDEDLDFRWLYRILKPVSGKPIKDLIGNDPLPAPRRTGRGPRGVENCIGGTIKVPTIPPVES